MKVMWWILSVFSLVCYKIETCKSWEHPLLRFFHQDMVRCSARKGASTKTDDLNLIPRIYMTERKNYWLLNDALWLLPHYTRAYTRTHTHTYIHTQTHIHRAKKERLIDETETQRDGHRNREKRDRQTHREIKGIKTKANFIYLMK